MAGVTKHVFQLSLHHSRVVWYHFCRNYSSTLYLTGDKAKETFSVITPHLDTENRFKDIESLKHNVKLRGLKLDLDSMMSIWKILKKIEASKVTLESKREAIAKKIKELKVSEGDTEQEIEKLKFRGKLLRDDLKTTVKALWEVEKNIIPKILSLPNNLHARTPNVDVELVSEFGEVPKNFMVQSHLEIGKKFNILDYYNPEFYYLKDGAAIFELGLLNYFTDEISGHGFVKFCNSDFSRSVVVEGCGLDHEDPLVTYILQDIDEILLTKDSNRLHLVGGASLMSFFAFHAKQLLPDDALPWRLVALGRQYKPPHQNGEGLLGVCQCPSVELFTSNKDEHTQVMDEFDNCVTLLTKIYENLGHPFRVVYVPAMQLKLYESLRASFQMYSLHLQSYVEIGHLSLCDDFISKRLLLQYGTEKQPKFVHVISGTAISVPKFLACLLELYSDATSFDTIPVSEDLRKYLL